MPKALKNFGMNVPGKLTPIGWQLPKGLSEDDWAVAGACLQRVEGAVQWWLGDWWAYGEHAYGDRKALFEEGGPLAGFRTHLTVKKYGYVAKNVERLLRSNLLDWEHHYVVASLPPAQQRKWLGLAIKGTDGKQWSAGKLRHYLMRAEDETRVLSLEPIRGKFQTLIIDPPWDYGALSLAGRAAPLYKTMTHEELLAFEPQQWAADNCAMFCWVTNNFVMRGGELMTHWGFDYKTILTWVKPRMGMGSYFRNTTEHVLFGVRGDVGTRRDDLPTHFEAPMGEPSEKPERFYEIVRVASYPEYGEIFQRTARPDFMNVFRARGKNGRVPRGRRVATQDA